MPTERAVLPPFSRRQLLAGGLIAGVSVVLAACGSGEASPGESGRPSASPSAPPASPSQTPVSAPPSPTPDATPAATPSLAQKIAGLVIVGFRGATLEEAPWVREALAESGLGGVILFDRDQLTGGSRNIRSPEQLATLVRDLHEAAGTRRALVSIDQEGGVVTRLSPAHGFPAVESEATVGQGTADDARTWATGLASTLASVGIDLDFAPVVDLGVDPHSPAIGALDRSFSADPAIVVEMAAIEIDALREAGVLATLKHFPGIGSATTNTDFGVADVTDTWTRAELEPFARLIAAGMADLVMAGHVVNGQLDPDRPASLSAPTVTGLLRGELGWGGAVVTDDLQAAAITEAFGADEALLLALEAGDDLLLLANQQVYDPGVVDHVVAVVTAAIGSGRLSEARITESWERVQRLRR